MSLAKVKAAEDDEKKKKKHQCQFNDTIFVV